MKQKPHGSDEEKIRDFQNKLYLKAKEAKNFRFFVLYDKVIAKRFLREACKRVKKNGDIAGVDRVTFKDIESYGIKQYLDEIHYELMNKTYKPQAVLRIHIPEADSKGYSIPTIKDRIVQMSCKMVIEPIFRADFENNSYVFYKMDAELKIYFDRIPYKKLLNLIGKRTYDKDIIHLIRMWLKAPVIEDYEITDIKKNQIESAQVDVISPLLANIYFHWQRQQ